MNDPCMYCGIIDFEEDDSCCYCEVKKLLQTERAKNKVLMEALRFYAEPNGSRVSGLTTHTMYMDDIDTHESVGYKLKMKGRKAREALKKCEEL